MVERGKKHEAKPRGKTKYKGEVKNQLSTLKNPLNSINEAAVLIEEILLDESNSFSKKVFRKKRQQKIMDQPFNQVENVAEIDEEMECLKIESEKQEMSAQIGKVVKKVKRNLTAGIKRLSIASSGSLQELTKALLATFPRRKGKITHLPLTLDGEIDIRENQDDVKIDAVDFEENQLTLTFANLRNDDLSIEVIKWEADCAKFNGLSAVNKPIIFTDKLIIDLNHSNTQKHFQQCIERYDDEFFPWIEFEFTRKTEIKIYWIIFEWKKESSLWFPRFTNRRPFLGGLVWRNGFNIRSYKGLLVKDFLSVSDVKFDQTMIQFKLKTTPGFNPAVRFTQRKPRDKGIRMVVLSNQELNPEQENFCLDKDGETIAITFRNPRAHAWLRDDEVREKKINWPFFSLCFEEISKSIQIRLQFKWRKETAEWIPEFFVMSSKTVQKESTTRQKTNPLKFLLVVICLFFVANLGTYAFDGLKSIKWLNVSWSNEIE